VPCSQTMRNTESVTVTCGVANTTIAWMVTWLSANPSVRSTKLTAGNLFGTWRTSSRKRLQWRKPKRNAWAGKLTRQKVQTPTVTQTSAKRSGRACWKPNRNKRGVRKSPSPLTIKNNGGIRWKSNHKKCWHMKRWKS